MVIHCCLILNTICTQGVWSQLGIVSYYIQQKTLHSCHLQKDGVTCIDYNSQEY